ncbi:MAG: hypothetical protein ABSE53_16885 [Terracidiphilus sp.]|jgi:hypothetical protein
MKLEEAKEKLLQILEEEQIYPTVGYKDSWEPSSVRVKQALEEKSVEALLKAYDPAPGLENERKSLRRPVYENPNRYKFESSNYSLLVTLFQNLSEADRSAFFLTLLQKIADLDTAWTARTYARFPTWKNCFSYLPLVAEFCVRTNHTASLIKSLREVQRPTTGMVIMFMELQEMISLNFNLFSDAEFVELSDALGELSNAIGKFTWQRKRSGGRLIENPDYEEGYAEPAEAIMSHLVAIIEQCRKARFFYLKGALQKLPNLEIEADKKKVEGFLVKLGFTGSMLGALNAAESDYTSTATVFELKNCLEHLRSFLEYLHRESAKSVATTSGDAVSDKWGDATLYLRQKGLYTKQHEAFVATLYTLISDTSVHPLGADREYARLLRNVVIEYGVMFLTTLDKSGVKIN